MTEFLSISFHFSLFTFLRITKIVIKLITSYYYTTNTNKLIKNHMIFFSILKSLSPPKDDDNSIHMVNRHNETNKQTDKKKYQFPIDNTEESFIKINDT